MTERISVNQLQVLIDGDGDETLLMIHGWPDTHRLWDATVERLQPHYRCARFTLPGYDRDHQRKLYDLEHIIKDIDAIVDAISPNKPVTLVIHDWGCVWGYQYYMRHSQKVARIVAVDIGDANSPEHMQILTTKSKLFGMGYQLFLALAWNLGSRIGDIMTKKMAQWLNAPGDPNSIHSGMTYSYWWKWGAAFKGKELGTVPIQINCPLLFTYGKNKSVPFHSNVWAKKMAAIEGNQVEGFDTGHWVMSEAPEQFNSQVFEWLNRTDTLLVKAE